MKSLLPTLFAIAGILLLVWAIATAYTWVPVGTISADVMGVGAMLLFVIAYGAKRLVEG